MKKRFIALLLCCVMIFTLSPSLISAASATDINGTTVETPTDEPTAEPTVEEPKTEESKTEEPKTEEPKTEEPKTEEPKAEEPKAEEPKAEEPKAEEPKAEEETTIPAAEQPGAPVESEIITPTVNFTNVAPFLAPVTGTSPQQTMLRTMAYSARANNETPDSGDNGMVINKTATANKDGSYTITLEAYATGEKVITEVKEDVPTDIILVLDQSGSMAEDIGTVSFQKYQNSSSIFGTTYHTRNQDYYEYRHNGGSGNLWHKLGDDSFVSVSVTKQEQMEYTQLSNLKNYETRYGFLTANCYYYYANNLYEKIGDVYSKVELVRSGDWRNGYVYTYTFSSDGTTVTSNGNEAQPNFGSHAPLYAGTTDDAQTVYIYTYTDANNNVQTIGTSTGAETVFSPTLYERVTSTSGGGSRLAAIQAAVTNFANAVTAKAKGTDGEYGTTDDINHRIAIIGFASGSRGNDSYPSYVNTELFIGANQYNYNVDASNHYGSAFQDMNTQAGYDNVMASKNALSAGGATHVDLGIQMANGVFGANAIQTGQKRNRVVIVFTDGMPSSWSDYDSTVANNAINYAKTTKADAPNGYGATVYSVGIFSGADATSAGDSNGNDTQKANRFMQQVSSNNGTPQTPSYYLSAADAGSLNSIFQQISDQIETGGSSSTLTSDAVVKDIISQQFTLPEGATTNSITLETYACTGKDSAGNYTWLKNNGAMGATATISSEQVSVTGFNFSENYVGTVTENGNVSYRGNKLVISFKVQPKAGFLGGNNVYTNGSAGIYENGSAENPLLTFDRPTVNVPIKDVTVTAADKNVYLLGGLTAAQLKEGAVVKCGDVELKLSESNYGLEAWQTAYVDITVKLYGADGTTEITDLTNLTDDTTYTISVTVAPKTNGTNAEGTPATAKSGANNPAANIHVFKPELTFKDSEVYYGDTVPADYSNLTATVWKHVETLDTAVTMVGTAPELTLGYTPDSNKIAGGKINTKQDIAVDVAVKIGNTDVTTDTTFKHTACTGKTCTVPTGKEFLLHVKTCSLTITKTGGTDGEPYVFNIYKDGSTNVYTQVTIVPDGDNRSVTIYELPVGTYTIVEDTGWSWRFNPTIGDGVTLSKTGASGTITCTNSLSKPYWLNGFSTVVENIFGVARVEQ